MILYDVVLEACASVTAQNPNQDNFWRRLMPQLAKTGLTLASLSVLLPVHYGLALLHRKGIFRDGKIKLNWDSLKSRLVRRG